MVDFFYWFSILFASILSSVAGTVAPAFFKQAAFPRTHHVSKLWSELIARHQFAYIPYFITLGFVGDFGKHEVLKNFILLLLVWVFISYLICVHISSNLQDRRFEKHHVCKDSKCEEHVGPLAFVKLFRGSIILALALLVISLIYAGVVKRQHQSSGEKYEDHVSTLS